MTSSRVLVVGAGPSGLTIALELARRGVPVRVIDKAPGPSGETRALGMQARTLELFERHGIVGELLRHGLRATRFNVFSEGRPILDADFGDLDSAYPFLLMIPQDRTEAILAAQLATHGVRVEREVTLAGLTQVDGGVLTVLEHADGTAEHSSVGWTVGADGAHSTVRKQLGLDFAGTSFEENFTVADLRVEWARQHDQFFAFLNRGRFVAMFPMLEGWHRVAIARRADDPGTGDVTLEELQRAFDATVPGPARIVEVRQSGRFRINQRRASRYSVDRVFLVGDAAHIHSVVGAQGMNTGIQDAFNLGWKLAAVIRGDASADLLDSYGSERTPVAERLVDGTRRITRLTLLKGPVRTWFRRHLAPRVLSRVRTRLTRAVAQLDVSYHDRSGAAPRGRAAVGDRAPDAPLVRGAGGARRVHELLDDRGHTLLCFDLPDGVAEEATAGIAAGGAGPVHVAHLTGEHEAASAYGLTAPGAVLVRPDGYVARRPRLEHPGNDTAADRVRSRT
ncbi:FAD-dependent oxidoreductase [Jiangella endophytica]|uniref:FAD-dependent oxidoreductase n=1 Tax=Jiangella endophytica TaxID=1623398 RepID=UPI0013007377|nr:FAD-dependent oxidoreductase [Jiangella endophytica]